MIALSCD